MRTVGRSAARLLLMMLSLGLPAAARAQEPARPTLSLQDVIDYTLTGNPVILRGTIDRDAREGGLLEAGAPFGMILRASVSGVHERDANGGQGGLPVALTGASYTIGASKLLRQGVLIEPEVLVSRASPGAIGDPYAASIALRFELPLANNRWAAVQRAEEQASEARYQAATLRLESAIAEGIRDAVLAYWDYLAAYHRLAVWDSAEARARRMVSEMELLVRADERPAADLNQALARLSSQRVARIAAEQELIEARRKLGLAMGVDPAVIAALPDPGTSFPPAEPFQPDSATVERWVQAALTRRADLAALIAESRALDIDLDAARNDLRPRLDLAGSFGFQRVAPSSGGLLTTRQDGFVVSLGVHYAFAPARAQARGRFAQQLALRNHARVLHAQLLREITSTVHAAVAELRRATAALLESRKAVELYREAVANERLKYEFGTATIMDVLLAEDALTVATLDEVARQLAQARAVVRLRFETGLLVERSREGVVVNVHAPEPIP